MQSLQGLPALSIAACMRVVLVKDMYAARCADVPHPDLHEHHPSQGQHRMCYRSQLKLYLGALQMQSYEGSYTSQRASDSLGMCTLQRSVHLAISSTGEKVPLAGG